MKAQRFDSIVEARAKGGISLTVPFDPDQVWGAKPRHPVSGTANGRKLRGVLEGAGKPRRLVLGATWQRDCGLEVGAEVTVVLVPEGPQRDELAPDITAAFEASPQAAAFFDGLAQFYRKAYLRWIDATKRRPELRAERIAAMVELLEAGIKERPKT